MILNRELGLKRINEHKGREVNRLDLENIDFHHKVREGYKILLEKFPERIIEVDASMSLEKVYNRTMEIIERRLLDSGKLKRTNGR